MTGTFQRDGIQFRYEVIGEGRPLVLCHGLSGERQQPKDLAGPIAGYRLIVGDCRGHGETQPVGPADRFGFGPMAEDFAALMDHLGVERAIVGGISMGAGISARFAVRWPQRVEALLFVRPAWLAEPNPANLALLPRAAQLLRQFGPQAGLAEFQKLPELAAIRADSPMVVDSLREQFGKPDALARAVRLERLPADCPVDNWGVVERLTMPALVVGNQRDAMHPMEFARVWAGHLPHARLVEIPSKSDSAERHASEFRRHLAEFLGSLEPRRTNRHG
jgi:pimeloyl-ACP methyl ester carboxylesterase